jgi:hypothetical protein
MANASYTAFKSGILTGAYDLDTAVIKVALVAGYVYSANHSTMADVTGAGGTLNGTPATLTNITVAAGVFDADDATITTTASSSTHALIVYQASAITGGADVTAANQRLMWYFDTGTNLPITPGAGVLTITWPNTAGKIYKVGA